uniref:Uncharacterized protein n=1 Tax=Streptomyces sp. NBC_00049 TaxID=2903617 RepID=A0AAU2JKJ6_9ACTN
MKDPLLAFEALADLGHLVAMVAVDAALAVRAARRYVNGYLHP